MEGATTSEFGTVANEIATDVASIAVKYGEMRRLVVRLPDQFASKRGLYLSLVRHLAHGCNSPHKKIADFRGKEMKNAGTSSQAETQAERRRE